MRNSWFEIGHEKAESCFFLTNHNFYTNKTYFGGQRNDIFVQSFVDFFTKRITHC